MCNYYISEIKRVGIIIYIDIKRLCSIFWGVGKFSHKINNDLVGKKCQIFFVL